MAGIRKTISAHGCRQLFNERKVLSDPDLWLQAEKINNLNPPGINMSNLTYLCGIFALIGRIMVGHSPGFINTAAGKNGRNSVKITGASVKRYPMKKKQNQNPKIWGGSIVKTVNWSGSFMADLGRQWTAWILIHLNALKYPQRSTAICGIW